MAEIVPDTGNLEQDLKAITELLQNRDKYRKGGMPCPTELTNISELVQTLDAMVPILKKRVNAELATRAVSEMQHVVAAHKAALSRPERQRDAVHLLGDIPKTISEQLLEKVSGAIFDVRNDAEAQSHARWRLEIYKYCRTDCWYPDRCRDRRMHDNCCLMQLVCWQWAPWWRKLLLGQRFVPAYPYSSNDLYALRRIRGSMYYDKSQEKRLKNIYRSRCLHEPELCR